MKKHTFDSLVNEREFDVYQPGLISRWKAHRLDYKLTYSEPRSKSSMILDFASDETIGQVILWTSGECELMALDKTTGERVFFEGYHFDDADQFFSTYVRLPLFLMDKLEEE